MAELPQAENILQHDDCGVDHHADGEGNAGQRDDIDGTAECGHGNERPDDGNRDRETDHQRGIATTQEQVKHQRGQDAADPDILAHQIN